MRFAHWIITVFMLSLLTLSTVGIAECDTTMADVTIITDPDNNSLDIDHDQLTVDVLTQFYPLAFLTTQDATQSTVATRHHTTAIRAPPVSN
ncbi:hypothetical protein ACSLBF_03500 [Pseudoalteromonas sp. T1lg65]|uniref:hypothetical protein n=1 Tax=Pseudoalteromonas sp. T1lg65 TaxID=2077101 RepID=UPI003F7A5DE7